MVEADIEPGIPEGGGGKAGRTGLGWWLFASGRRPCKGRDERRKSKDEHGCKSARFVQ